jgi:uncharacterized membrane protein YkvA (DUF1232 family)
VMIRSIKRFKFIFQFKKFIPFLRDFFLTNQVGKGKKLLYAGIGLGYILFPFDIIPDFILGLGFIDDITVVLFILERMVKSAPASLREKYSL